MSLTVMEWITLGSALASGVLGVGVAWGMLRAEIKALRIELAILRENAREETRKLTQRQEESERKLHGLLVSMAFGIQEPPSDK